MGFAKTVTADDGALRAEAAPCPLPDGFHCIARRDAADESFLLAWRDLARRSADPNPFFEPWFLLPSLAAFDPRDEARLAILVAGGSLVALMPVWCNADYHGRRIAHRSPWMHDNMFLGAPLILRDREHAFWSAYLAHADRSGGKAFFAHFPMIPGNSASTRALLDLCRDQGRLHRVVRRERRALLRSGPTPDDHLAQAMSSKKRKELRRQRNRLAEEGRFELRRSRGHDGLGAWIDGFLTLEQRGWKGRQGSALADDPRSSAVFRGALEGACREGRLERLSLELDGRPLAMLATFLTPPGSFAFKTCFDEDFARYSPGMLLQVENLALLDDEALDWCDSCAAMDHPMIERIWRDRRDILWITAGSGRGWRRRAGELGIRIEARRAERRA